MMMSSSEAPVASRRPCEVNLIERNAIASAKTAERRAKILADLTRYVIDKKPMPSEATIAELHKVADNTVRDDLRVLRSQKLLETRHRKFRQADQSWSVEFSMRVGAGDWTPWPTDRVDPAKRHRRKRAEGGNGAPPQHWAMRREKVASAHTAPSVVEQAKDALRRHGVKLVHHLDTIERPNQAHVPNLGAPGLALVVVGGLVMPETEVVALARRLAAGEPMTAAPQ
jgi:hypothetical protein